MWLNKIHDFFFSFFLCVRVLTLWFDYGHWPEVNEALVEGIKTIQIDTWLQVIRMLYKYCRHCKNIPFCSLPEQDLFSVTF